MKRMVGAVVVFVAVAGCGGGSGKPAAAKAPSPSPSPTRSAQDLTACQTALQVITAVDAERGKLESEKFTDIATFFDGQEHNLQLAASGTSPTLGGTLTLYATDLGAFSDQFSNADNISAALAGGGDAVQAKIKAVAARVDSDQDAIRSACST